MPLTTCPDCLKQISDRVEACPYCGCPAKFFPSLTENILPTIPEDSIVESTRPIILENEDGSIKKDEGYITFSFGTSQIKYPKNTENIAKLYGKYVSYTNGYYEKYYELYPTAGSMYSVLTDLTKKVISDIQQIVEEACKDLYSFGIKITSSYFIKKYKINFKNEIKFLYDQYDSIQEEKKEIAYHREIKKANRGHWQGGGFGMKGAIKGAVNAAVLNAGSDLLHSIGDGITKSSDNRYINNKLSDIYKSQKNRNDFAQNVFICIYYILEGIKNEMSDAGIIDIDIFGTYAEVESNYETVVKYESNPEKLLDGMVRCFSCIPENVKYYEPIINVLFELDSDLEAFLQFWGLNNLFKYLEQRYIKAVIGNVKNPFVRNVADIAIEIQGSLTVCEKGIVIVGKIIKGNVNVGDSITLLKKGFCAGISTVISSIFEENGEVSLAKVGRVYKFLVPIKQDSLFNRGMLLVDSNSFEKVEADLYARYYQDKKKIIWGFDDYCLDKGNNVLFYFDSEDKYISCRGVDFTFDAQKVMEIYGKTTEKNFDSNNDITLSCAKRYNWEDAVNALAVAAFSLSYTLGKEYIIRFYFDNNSKMLLAVYMKNIDTSKESSNQEDSTSISKVKLKVECHKCGNVIIRDTKYCNFCGEPNPLFMKECPICGKQIKNDAKFCNFCGTQLI
jgi:hypothetical protein